MSKRKEVSYEFMKDNTVEEVIKKVLEKATSMCTIAYQGGEPTLRGIEFFRKTLEYEKKHNINNVKITHSSRENIHFIEDSKIYNESCPKCSYFKICRGGCKRNKNKDREYYFCESYKLFFKNRLNILIHI